VVPAAPPAPQPQSLTLDDPPPPGPLDPALEAAIRRILVQPRMTPQEAVAAFIARPILRGPVDPTTQFMPTIRDALVAGGHQPEAVDLSALRRDLGDLATHLTTDNQLWLDSPWILGMLGLRSYLSARQASGEAGTASTRTGRTEWGWAVPYLIMDELLATGRSPIEVLSFHNTFMVGEAFGSSNRYSMWPGHDWSYPARWLTLATMRHAVPDADDLPRLDELLFPRNPAYQWWLSGRPTQPFPALPGTPPVPDLAGRQIRTEAALGAEVIKIIATWGLTNVLPGPHKAGWDEYTVKVSIYGFDITASRGRANAISRVVPGLLRDVHRAVPAIGMLALFGLSGARSNHWEVGLVRHLGARYQLRADGAE